LMLLYRLNASVELQDNSGKTSLHYAAQYNKIAIVRQLLHIFEERSRSKAHLEVRDKKGRTPLFLAVISLSSQTSLELIRVGADVDSRDSLGRTPLQAMLLKTQASLANTSPSIGVFEMTRTLLEHGANPHSLSFSINQLIEEIATFIPKGEPNGHQDYKKILALLPSD